MICKVCQEGKVRPFLSLGKLPLGNAFLREEQFKNERLFDLDLGFCENCTLVQQTSPPPQGVLMEDYKNYHYVPLGNTLKRHYGDLGEALVRDLGIKRDSFVIDIGSNDGTLLNAIKHYQDCRILGVEPAEQISQSARNAGIPTITGFFSEEIAHNIVSEYGQADLVCTTQVLQHIPDPAGLIHGVSHMLKPQGAYAVEGRYIADTITKTTFDTIYHEMLHFFTLKSLEHQLKRDDLTPIFAKQIDIYGGSLRIYSKKGGGSENESLSGVREYEKGAGLDDLSNYEKFATRVHERRAIIGNFVRQLKDSGNKIAGYGAPSTGTTLMNFCELDRKFIDYIIDDSPLKQGLYQPGTHIPIVDSSVLEKRRPDYLLLIAWRLKEDILSKVKQYREKGMKVILPLPELEVI